MVKKATRFAFYVEELSDGEWLPVAAFLGNFEARAYFRDRLKAGACGASAVRIVRHDGTTVAEATFDAVAPAAG